MDVYDFNQQLISIETVKLLQERVDDLNDFIFYVYLSSLINTETIKN